MNPNIQPKAAPAIVTASTRRQFLAALAASGALLTERGAYAQALTLTPAQTEGPYYPDQLPLDRDNDLLVINDNLTAAAGTVSWISGRVLDRNGSPVRGAVVEIWGADNVGSYIHSRGALNGQRDGNYQGYGRFETASDGLYLFRAIKPGLYPGRVRHLHYKITIPGGTSLTTQLYIEGETGTNDAILNGITNAAQRASVIRPWTPIAGSPIGALAVTFDIVMGFTPPEEGTATRPVIATRAGVVQGASFGTGLASGSWGTIMGSGLATSTRSWRAADIVSGRLPESLDGVSVRINNVAAAVQYVSPSQINILAPETSADTEADVTVTNPLGVSTAVRVAFRRTLPAFFQFPSEHVAAVKADGTLCGPANLISGVATVPARPGETIQLYGTGFGPVIPAQPPIQTVSAPAPLANPVSVRIHQRAAEVTYAGLTASGLYQINVQVPDLPDGDYPVTATVAGVKTSKFVRLRIAQTPAANAPVEQSQALDPVVRQFLLSQR